MHVVLDHEQIVPTQEGKVVGTLRLKGVQVSRMLAFMQTTSLLAACLRLSLWSTASACGRLLVTVAEKTFLLTAEDIASLYGCASEIGVNGVQRIFIQSI